MNNQGLLALAQLILPSEILSNFEVVRVEEEASLIRIYLDESVKAEYKENRLSGNFWLVSFKISYLCLPLFYETRTTPSCHPSGCAYRQL